MKTNQAGSKTLLGGDEPRTARPSGTPKTSRPNPYAACVVRFGHDGKTHLYLNAGIPRGHHPSEGICTKCGHAYSHMVNADQTTCGECRSEMLAAAAQQFESAGISLGWGYAEHSVEYERESRQRWRAGKV